MYHHDPTPSGARIDGEDWTRSPSPVPASRGSLADPVERLVERFVAAWRRGDRPTAEDFIHGHPLPSARPEAAIRLIYEEVCLRQAEGEEVSLSELAGRFPQWRTELSVLLDCDRLIGAMPTVPALPEAGEDLGDFLLLAEIGQGARGRCFLASQPSLSNRRVVLKVTADDHAEHLSMARLQHTHIMPLYSEHEYPERRLRALCMPYLGGMTLARMLAEISGVEIARRTGRSLLDALDAGAQASPWPQSVASPARRFLAGTSYDRAVCWIVACLADALQYAHDRGLVHMDVKPSNILLTADGQPMLLDFHLAREPALPDSPLDEGVGGTPGYMSPEQEAAIKAMESGGRSAWGVDARADIYSLGCVLAEMLGMDRRAAGARSASSLGAVSIGLGDIVRKCLRSIPDRRYPDAASLAEDLRRHMADLPLRGVSNRSVVERWRKWHRRHPHALIRGKATLLVSVLAGLLTSVLWFAFLSPRLRSAGDALVEGQVLLDRGDNSGAARALTRGAALIEGLPGGERLSRELARALGRADHLEELDRLHHLVDRLRLVEAAADRAVAPAREVERHCRDLWESRHSLLRDSSAPVNRILEERLRDDLLDLAVIVSSLGVRQGAEPESGARAHRDGLKLLEEAEALFGPSHVVYLAKRRHAMALGLSDQADVAARGAIAVPPRTAWEFDAAGRVLLESGDLSRAEASFARALALRPQDFWPNFHQGVCSFRRGRYQDAVEAFRVCIALAPDRAECFYNRALAHSVLGHHAEAASDFRRAAALDPTLDPAPVGRGAAAARTARPDAAP